MIPETIILGTIRVPTIVNRGAMRMYKASIICAWCRRRRNVSVTNQIPKVCCDFCKSKRRQELARIRDSKIPGDKQRREKEWRDKNKDRVIECRLNYYNSRKCKTYMRMNKTKEEQELLDYQGEMLIGNYEN